MTAVWLQQHWIRGFRTRINNNFSYGMKIDAIVSLQ